MKSLRWEDYKNNISKSPTTTTARQETHRRLTASQALVPFSLAYVTLKLAKMLAYTLQWNAFTREYLLLFGWKRLMFFQNKVEMPAAAEKVAPSGWVKAKLWKSSKTGNGIAHRRPCLSLTDESMGFNSSSWVLDAATGLYCPPLTEKRNTETRSVDFICSHRFVGLILILSRKTKIIVFIATFWFTCMFVWLN